MQNQPMSIEDLDQLNLRSNKTILKQLEPEEYVIFSCNISKHNKQGTVQERTLLVTNRYLYNIDFKAISAQLFAFVAPSFTTKRKIPITSIEAITVGSFYLSDQLIVHVSKESDYRFSGFSSRREKFVNVLCIEYLKATGQKLQFYFKDDQDLSAYQTTDEDVAAGVSKTPKGNMILLSEVELQKGLDYVIKNKKDFYKTIKKTENFGIKNELQRQNIIDKTETEEKRMSVTGNTPLNSLPISTDRIIEQPKGDEKSYVYKSDVYKSALEETPQKTQISFNFTPMVKLEINANSIYQEQGNIIQENDTKIIDSKKERLYPKLY